MSFPVQLEIDPTLKLLFEPSRKNIGRAWRNDEAERMKEGARKGGFSVDDKRGVIDAYFEMTIRSFV